MPSTAKVLKWWRLAIPALCTIVTLCLFPGVGFSKTYTFYPVADAYIFIGIDFNFGTELNLVTEPGAYSFLKFDLSTIPANEKITGATLNAYCNQALPAFGFAVQLRAVSDTSWSETGITGKDGNYPAVGDLIATYDAGRQYEYNQWTIDTVYLPRGLVSYALSLGSGNLAVYNSRENAINRPYIQVTTTERATTPRYTYLNLGILPGGSFSDPWSINNSGQVVGYSADRAFLKTPGQPMENLGTLGGDGSFATAINASGQVVGQAQNSSGVLRAFLKSPNQPMEDLGAFGGDSATSYANEINSLGHVVGQAQDTSGFGRAFLWTPNNKMEDLGTLGGNESEAMHINTSGQVVGGAHNSAGSWRAFLKNPGKRMQDLGTLGGKESGAVGFNNVGQIVGSADVDASTSHGFLWDDGFMYDLNNLTVNLPPGVKLLSAHAINDRGWIVGQDSNKTAFLLIPQRSIVAPLLMLLLD